MVITYEVEQRVNSNGNFNPEDGDDTFLQKLVTT
jgi:hypothetical protein